MGRRRQQPEEVGFAELLGWDSRIPETIEDYAASDQIVHEPVALADRPRYYFDVHHTFPTLPEESIYQNVAVGLRLRMARTSRLHQQIIEEIIAATYDGQLQPETVFTQPVGVVPIPLPEVQVDVEEEPTERIGGFPDRKLLKIAAICLAAGALIPISLFPVAAAAQTDVKSFEQGWPHDGHR